MKNIILGIFTITIFFGANKVYAQCFCGNAGESAFEELKRSDTVFVGEVIQVEKVESTKKLEYEEFNVTFKVKTAWKTNLPETITIKNINSNGSNFKEKESYLVYAKIYENNLSAYIGCCTRTTLLSKATKYLEEFEKNGEKPYDIVEKPKPK